MNALKNISKRIFAFILVLQLLLIFGFSSYQKEEVFAAPLVVPAIEYTAYEALQTLLFCLGGAAAITVEESTTGALSSAAEEVFDEIYDSIDLYCMANGFGKYKNTDYTWEEFENDWSIMMDYAQTGVLEMNQNLLFALATWFYDTFYYSVVPFSDYMNTTQYSTFLSNFEGIMTSDSFDAVIPLVYYTQIADKIYIYALVSGVSNKSSYSYRAAGYSISSSGQYLPYWELCYADPSLNDFIVGNYTHGFTFSYDFNTLSASYSQNASNWFSSMSVVPSDAILLEGLYSIDRFLGTSLSGELSDIVWPDTNTAIDLCIPMPSTWDGYYDIVNPFPATWEEDSPAYVGVHILDDDSIAELTDSLVDEADSDGIAAIYDEVCDDVWVTPAELESIQNPPAEKDEEDTEYNEIPLDNISVPYVPAETGSYIENLKKKFPFCIPFDLVTCFQNFKNYSQADEAPVFTFTVPMPFINYTWTFTVDMNDYLTYVKIFRFGFLILFVIGLMFSTSKLIAWQLID